MNDLNATLEKYLEEVSSKPDKYFIDNDQIRLKIEFVCHCLTNKAPIRFLMACLLGKLDNPKVDIRKPYTEISGKGTYSGRGYDEQFIEPFVIRHKLPTNSTTAFLTPAFRNIDRLPVLMITAAYLSVNDRIGETVLALQSHTAADSQTGSIGDVEITLMNDDKVVTCYEMKDKRVTIVDIENAIKKISTLEYNIDNYIFITTDIIEEEVHQFAKSIYDKAGFEIAVLDCIGFVRHFLHFFHRDRTSFLNHYQNLVLVEPDSSVSQPLKEAFLVLRKTAESDK